MAKRARVWTALGVAMLAGSGTAEASALKVHAELASPLVLIDSEGGEGGEGTEGGEGGGAAPTTYAIGSTDAGAFAYDGKPVVAAYAALVLKSYEEAKAEAQKLQAAVDAFLATPSDDSLKAARAAWVAARPAYLRTETFRFYDGPIEDIEGNINAWPMNEAAIDYVEGNPNAGIINDGTTKIDKDTLEGLNQKKDEADVTVGWHAIEFLLWGQDLNGTKAGAGNRPYTDYDAANCTNGNCDRRAAFLKAVTDLLVADLAEMANDWAAGGAARSELAAKPARDGLGVILTGLGSLSYGELAGERMRLGLILHDPEEEQDCFSDNTHNSHYFDQAGMWAIYSGTYTRRDGSRLDGPGLQDLASEEAPADAKALDTRMQDTLAKMQAMKDRADSGKEAYDQMIAAGNTEGNAVVQAAIDGLIAQTHAIEALVTAMKLSIKVEGSDSLDNPSAVNAQ